jgi:osmotically-inducible protein OsmY
MKNDSDLKLDVENELKWEPVINEAHIGVTARSGVVTLTGHVGSYSERCAAERAAKRIYGVKAVANDLEVQLPGAAIRSDDEIALTCVNALKTNHLVPADRIKVIVSDKKVTLEGQVQWRYQREAAHTAVCNLIGVAGVMNKIVVSNHLATKDIRDKIVAAFHRHADIDARRIDVEAEDGRVILRGNVRSLSEREEAQHAAWAAPGVTSVENDITVTP